ncbi:MAG: hypothetical protein SOY62_10100, partial [Streptococcus orisratti]|nr:hypothetical protein [Streptococcus orisratti]
LFGLVISVAITFIASKLSNKVTLAYWIVNPLLGILGAIAANYLLGGQYGPVLFGQTILPMLAGALVLPGVGSWTINFIKKKSS